MKGYYAIYSHSQDGWWTDGGYCYKQKQYVTKVIPMGYTISVGNSVGGATATANNYENVVTDDSAAEFSPFYIKKFDTLNDAETYLLSGKFYMNGSTDFVTIRKIYM
jgi:hypothetical protein